MGTVKRSVVSRNDDSLGWQYDCGTACATRLAQWRS